MILITGASGEVGGRVARLLTIQGHKVRLLVRNPRHAPGLRDAEVAIGDYADPKSLVKAFANVDTAFLVSGYAKPGERWKLHANAIDAAKAAGVSRLVYLSFQGAAPNSAFSFARDHNQTENHIFQSGMKYTFLRPNLYMDYVPSFFNDSGIVRGPAGNGKAAWVSRDDLAAVVSSVLVGKGHENQTYEVTGPEALSLRETADRLSVIVDKPLVYKIETREEAFASRKTFAVPEWEVEAWVSSYEAIAVGELAKVSQTVSTLTGKKPASMEEFFSRETRTLERLRKS